MTEQDALKTYRMAVAMGMVEADPDPSDAALQEAQMKAELADMDARVKEMRNGPGPDILRCGDKGKQFAGHGPDEGIPFQNLMPHTPEGRILDFCFGDEAVAEMTDEEVQEALDAEGIDLTNAKIKLRTILAAHRLARKLGTPETAADA